jgi:hypothetical protein
LTISAQQYLKIAEKFFLLIFLIFIFGIFSINIWDPDFWWHLKTGEYIYQTGSLPETDPFAYTSLTKDPVNPESKRIKFILTQYWLAQIIFYRIFDSFSYQGIIFLRALILTSLIFLIYRALRREGAGFYISVACLIPAVIIMQNSTGERPQLFSFLLAFSIFSLLECFRRISINTQNPASNSALYYLIPVPFIMILWANLHGAFILGNIIILTYIFSETTKYLLKRFGTPVPLRSLKYLLTSGLISILFSFINPNNFNVIPFMIELGKSSYAGMIMEAMSPIYFIASGLYNKEFIAFFFLLFICLILLIMNIKRLDLTDCLLFAGLTTMSLLASRAIPFFTPVVTILIARYGVRISKRIILPDRFERIMNIIKARFSFLRSSPVRIFFSLFISVILIFEILQGNYLKNGVAREKYPGDAVSFLKEQKISGNMFNPYIWGGYLIWELYPDYKVFIDGRGLIEDIFLQENDVWEASSSDLAGLPKWKAILNAYNINFIVTHSVDESSGELIPLIKALMNDPEWYLIYTGNNSLIFIRGNSENAEIINRLAKPKEWVWNEVIMEAALKSINFSDNINYYITMGDAFFALRNYTAARNAYLRAWKINPQSSLVRQRLSGHLP